MSTPGRPKGESVSAQRERGLVVTPGRPNGESVSAQREVSSSTLLRTRDTGVADQALLPLEAFLAAGAPAGTGVLLAPTDDPRRLAPHLAQLTLVAVDFPKFSDGRGYSIAALLRQRLGYAGELRAVGDVVVDQLYFLKRVGFDAFQLRAGQDPSAIPAALARFSDHYQASSDVRAPHFRRAQEALS